MNSCNFNPRRRHMLPESMTDPPFHFRARPADQGGPLVKNE